MLKDLQNPFFWHLITLAGSRNTGTSWTKRIRGEEKWLCSSTGIHYHGSLASHTLSNVSWFCFPFMANTSTVNTEYRKGSQVFRNQGKIEFWPMSFLDLALVFLANPKVLQFSTLKLLQLLKWRQIKTDPVGRRTSAVPHEMPYLLPKAWIWY